MPEVTFEGESIDEISQSTLRILRQEDGGMTTGKIAEEMGDREEYRGRVHHRVKRTANDVGKLNRLGLVEKVGERERSGDRKNAHLYGLTDEGREFVDGNVGAMVDVVPASDLVEEFRRMQDYVDGLEQRVEQAEQVVDGRGDTITEHSKFISRAKDDYATENYVDNQIENLYIGELDSRVSTLEERVDDLEAEVQGNAERLDELEEKQDRMNDVISKIQQELGAVTRMDASVHQRLNRLEELRLRERVEVYDRFVEWRDGKMSGWSVPEEYRDLFGL
ncbi:hypothetical protein C475_08932 [Halosimplex carlsbadense 2-9-1]|uniref:Uncharacterized protein n=1 Tax=Halosimplex carlsbadense 2-9-1 TaxID=797114 RepID=M0CVB0_9EURY|nr:hypothetical protein [Halosimplex carlsbadense]ELZ26538.1 hypothetical protein C475_08932 [Halosimplex carlsbadense 2-9-1]